MVLNILYLLSKKQSTICGFHPVFRRVIRNLRNGSTKGIMSAAQAVGPPELPPADRAAAFQSISIFIFFYFLSIRPKGWMEVISSIDHLYLLSKNNQSFMASIRVSGRISGIIKLFYFGIMYSRKGKNYDKQ